MSFLIFESRLPENEVYWVYHNMSRFCCEEKLSYFPSFVHGNVDWSDYLDRNYLNKSQFENYVKKKSETFKHMMWISWRSERTSLAQPSKSKWDILTDNSVVKFAQISRQLSSLLMIAFRQWMTVGPKRIFDGKAEKKEEKNELFINDKFFFRSASLRSPST